jgi:hypothetical protein
MTAIAVIYYPAIRANPAGTAYCEAGIDVPEATSGLWRAGGHRLVKVARALEAKRSELSTLQV